MLYKYELFAWPGEKAPQGVLNNTQDAVLEKYILWFVGQDQAAGS